MKVVEEEEIVIPMKRKPEDDIVSLLTKTNTEHANQIRDLKAELKKSVQSTRQIGKFTGTKILYLSSSQYGEGKYFLHCQSFMWWLLIIQALPLEHNYGTSVVKHKLVWHFCRVCKRCGSHKLANCKHWRRNKEIKADIIYV